MLQSNPCHGDRRKHNSAQLHILDLLQSNPCKHVKHQHQCQRQQRQRDLHEQLESKALQTHLTESDLERALGDLHGKHGSSLKPEFYQRAPDDETVAAPAAAATEHSRDAITPELASHEFSGGKRMTYAIVNELLGKTTLNNPQAEELLLAAL
jgi:hypothetical protein